MNGKETKFRKYITIMLFTHMKVQLILYAKLSRIQNFTMKIQPEMKIGL